MTAMFDKAMFDNAMNDTVHNDKDRFTATELAALRSDLLQGGMLDSYEAERHYDCQKPEAAFPRL